MWHNNNNNGDDDDDAGPAKSNDGFKSSVFLGRRGFGAMTTEDAGREKPTEPVVRRTSRQ